MLQGCGYCGKAFKNLRLHLYRSHTAVWVGTENVVRVGSLPREARESGNPINYMDPLSQFKGFVFTEDATPQRRGRSKDFGLEDAIPSEPG